LVQALEAPIKGVIESVAFSLRLRDRDPGRRWLVVSNFKPSFFELKEINHVSVQDKLQKRRALRRGTPSLG